eukprot:3479194-Rhodomonas_salina.1
MDNLSKQAILMGYKTDDFKSTRSRSATPRADPHTHKSEPEIVRGKRCGEGAAEVWWSGSP